MSKPLMEYASSTVWKVLVAIIVITIAVLSVIGMINASNDYVEPVNPLYDPYYYDKYEGRYPDDDLWDRYYGN